MTPANSNRKLEVLIQQLDTENIKDRIKAIETLGEVGDKICLRELRARMRSLHEEYIALIIAIEKLKSNLNVK